LKGITGRPSVAVIGRLAYYTVQLRRPEDGWSRLPELSAGARQAGADLRREGTPVRFVRAIFVPEDEACFHLFEARSADEAREAARRAALPVVHVVEAVTGPGSPAWAAGKRGRAGLDLDIHRSGGSN